MINDFICVWIFFNALKYTNISLVDLSMHLLRAVWQHLPIFMLAVSLLNCLQLLTHNENSPMFLCGYNHLSWEVVMISLCAVKELRSKTPRTFCLWLMPYDWAVSVLPMSRDTSNMSLVLMGFRGIFWLSRVACFSLVFGTLFFFCYIFFINICTKLWFWRWKGDFFKEKKIRLFFAVFACFQRIFRVFHRESWQHWAVFIQ